MLSTDLAPAPTRQALEAQNRSAPGRVTGKLKDALDRMIWLGLRRAEAAQSAGMAEKGLQAALAKPHVRSYYLRQLDVLRTSGKARRIHRLEQLAEQDDNKQAAINAIRALDYIEDEQHQRHNGAFSSSPGLVIVVNGGNVTASPVLTEQQRQPQVIDNDE